MRPPGERSGCRRPCRNRRRGRPADRRCARADGTDRHPSPPAGRIGRAGFPRLRRGTSPDSPEAGGGASPGAPGRRRLGQFCDDGLAAVLRVVVDQQQLPIDSAFGEGGVNALSQGGNVGAMTRSKRLRHPLHNRQKRLQMRWRRGRDNVGTMRAPEDGSADTAWRRGTFEVMRHVRRVVHLGSQEFFKLALIQLSVSHILQEGEPMPAQSYHQPSVEWRLKVMGPRHRVLIRGRDH